jgi:LPXTG-site transpeptidase (sortase) family protein
MSAALRWLERFLFLVAIVAIGWYATIRLDAAREQAALSRDLENARAEAAAGFARSVGPRGRVVPVDTRVQITAVAARSLIGRIEVPRLKLSAVAREGVDVRTLRSAVGHVPGTAMPGAEGNAAFAAHRDTFFRPLEGVRAGDDVIVTTPGGVHRYTVTGTRIVDPSEVSVLQPAGGRHLTLVTCYPFNFTGSAPKRFIVQATLRDTPSH